MQVPWLDPDQYDRVKRKIHRLLYRHIKARYPSKPIIYRLSAVVNLQKKKSESKYENLGSRTTEHRDHWIGRVPALVAEHSAKNIFEELNLEVVWHFDKVIIGSEDGKTLADKIWNAVDTKLVTNWKGHPFLPLASLDGIFSREMIRELINNDSSLSENDPADVESEGQHGLRKWLSKELEEVFLKATRLIAICIFGQKPLSCLYTLMKTFGLRDTDLPLTLEKTQLHKRDLDPLMKVQKNFIVYNFDAEGLKKKMKDGTYEVICSDVVLPIKRIGNLGGGGFGIVDEVTIQPGHHSFHGEVS